MIHQWSKVSSSQCQMYRCRNAQTNVELISVNPCWGPVALSVWECPRPIVWWNAPLVAQQAECEGTVCLWQQNYFPIWGWTTRSFWWATSLVWGRERQQPQESESALGSNSSWYATVSNSHLYFNINFVECGLTSHMYVWWVVGERRSRLPSPSSRHCMGHFLQ